jgi:hypothetical protein
MQPPAGEPLGKMALLPVGVGRKLAFMGRPLVFVTANWTLWMISRILDSLDDLCLVGLIVFGKFLHTLIGSFGVRSQPLRISGLPSTIRAGLPYIGVTLIQFCVTITTLICSAAHGVSASF